MKDAIAGFLAGVIVAIGLMASSASSMKNEALTSAAASGYLVHDDKAYRVIPVAEEVEKAEARAYVPLP